MPQILKNQLLVIIDLKIEVIPDCGTFIACKLIASLLHDTASIMVGEAGDKVSLGVDRGAADTEKSIISNNRPKNRSHT